jgi:protein TonB
MVLCSGVSAAAQTPTLPPAATPSTSAPPPLQSPVTPPTLEAGQRCQQFHRSPLLVSHNSVLPTVVSVTVAADGSVKNVTVIQSSGFDSLDQTAVECISSTWRYKPAIQDGQPVEIVKKYEIVWHMNGAR